MRLFHASQASLSACLRASFKLRGADPDHQYWFDFYKKQFYTAWNLAASP
jgi:hypothetical protein